MYHFSASTGCFYPDELLQDCRDNHSLPTDLIAVGDEVFQEFTGVPPKGKQKGVGIDGKPAWVDIPPTEDQLSAAEQERRLRRRKAVAYYRRR
ncbi:tail fiber assembly protein [Serratia fonticola]|uniref:tail fiber assembly protein n=1 Tax=Serratia fonticola TaxID=47917 RepID=UPI003B586CDD